jgi:hypothetical protein
MRSISLAMRAVRDLGLYPVALYGLYELQKRTGWLRSRTPIKKWEAIHLEALVFKSIPTEPEAYSKFRLGLSRSFFFHPKQVLSDSLHKILAGEEELLLTEADEITAGQFRLFGGPAIEYGFPPDWKKPPIFNAEERVEHFDNDVHWTRLNPEKFPFDIKFLWEPARFGWSVILGRAYRLTGDDKYAESFWALFEHWREENPPNQGVHWISGQEVAIRLMVLVFCLYAFHPYLERHPECIKILAEAVSAHAERIPPSLLYAKAQGNNHLIVESVGLYTAGLMFPEFLQATRWRKLGRRWLIRAIEKQIFPDGGYVQHSVNYHRLALQASLWALRLSELNGDHFPPSIYARLQKNGICLGSFLDPATGHVPNFGSNDGALILPVTTCTIRDYRPVTQLVSRILLKEPAFGPGPWDEACFWFGLGDDEVEMRVSGRETHVEDVETQDVDRKYVSKIVPLSGVRGEDKLNQERAFPYAGLYFLRGKDTWGLFRCVHFNHRPGHGDQLHLDLWWRGGNIARDAGTFLYNGERPWENGLAGSKVHNTPVVNEIEPMSRAGRFLWLDWAQGKLLRKERSKDGLLDFISAGHDGYRALGIRVVRSVIRAGDELWMIVDDILGSGQHTLRSGWLLPDSPWRMNGGTLAMDGAQGQYEVKFTSKGVLCGLYRAGQLVEGEELTDCPEILGWYSPTYAYKEPGLYFIGSIKGDLPLRSVSLWSLGEVDMDQLKVEWSRPAWEHTPISRITYGEAELDF